MSEISQTQQETTSTATPAPTTTSEGKTETAQATQTTTESTAVAETWTYNGDRKSVPKEFQTYVQGLDRYVSKKDQLLGEARRKAEEYDKLVTSDDYKAYQQRLAQPKTTGTPTPAETVTQEELDAIMAGDANTLREVIRREAKHTLETDYKSEIERVRSVEQKQQQLETGEMIKAFKELHPDFNDFVDDDAYYGFMVSGLKGGKDLDTVYAEVKRMEERAYAKAEEKYKKTIESKKAGSVVGKSASGTPDVVYAETEDQAKRLAIQLAMKGDPRQVAVKRK